MPPLVWESDLLSWGLSYVTTLTKHGEMGLMLRAGAHALGTSSSSDGNVLFISDYPDAQKLTNSGNTM